VIKTLGTARAARCTLSRTPRRVPNVLITARAGAGPEKMVGCRCG
jgi:hypothetical protein